MKFRKPTIPINCFFQGCYNPNFEKVIAKSKTICHKYNKLHPCDHKRQTKILKKLLGKIGENAIITPPFWCDYGYNVEVGNSFYANHGLIVNDGAGVKFGDNVFIAPNCVFTTAEHALDAQMRKDGVEIAKPIVVGNNVWIGAGTIVLAGAEIGDNTVIGAGSVVKGKIPANVVAVGVPCKVKREITEEDKHSYPTYQGTY